MRYILIDSGYEQKLERFGDITLIRPCPQAIWRPSRPDLWNQADATFSRESDKRWEAKKPLPSSWKVECGGVMFKVSSTDFGHLGIFPEHAEIWNRMRTLIKPEMRVLNLFAYSGGLTMAAAQQGAAVCHLDASAGMVDWAKENAHLNSLSHAPIRWIVDDAIKFVKREIKRGSFYEGVVLDPPTFGRGAKGEVFKIERDIIPLLELCKAVLSDRKRFLIFSCHTPQINTCAIYNVMEQIFGSKGLETSDMFLKGEGTCPIPSGSYGIKMYD